MNKPKSPWFHNLRRAHRAPCHRSPCHRSPWWAVVLAVAGCGESAPPVAGGVQDAATDATADRQPDTAAAPAEVSAGADSSRSLADSQPAPDATPAETAAPKDAKPALVLSGLAAPPDKGVPEFSGVLDSTGTAVAPSALQGKWTVLWFYPAAQTSG